jgi:hypothetical protein
MTKLTNMEREALDSLFMGLPVHREGIFSKIKRLIRRFL